ncbi:MAG: YiiX family permuted papain-like enzyme [Flavipsychrobacter sp.]
MQLKTLIIPLLITLAVASALTSCRGQQMELKDGDIVFQSTYGGQGKAIQIATHSKYSHCGIIYLIDGKPYVYEAVQPVKMTPLDRWIARGDDGHYVIKRLKNTDALTPDVLNKMKAAGEQFKGKDYDIYFGWSDNDLYCSELVWKIYKRGAGIEVGTPQKLSSFDLSNVIVQQQLAERYGSNIPYNETVISPAAIFESDKLITVEEQ